MCLKSALLAAVLALPLQVCPDTPAYAQKMELEVTQEQAFEQFARKVDSARSDQDRAFAEAQMSAQLGKLMPNGTPAPQKQAGQEGIRLRPVEISLSTAILFALNKNPDVDIQKERTEQAAQYAEEGKAPLLPQVTVKVDAGETFDKPTAGATQWKGKTVETATLNFLIEQLLWDGHQTKNEVERRTELINAGNMKTEIKAQEVITDTIKHYLDVMRYQNAVADERLFLTKIEDIVSIVKHMYDAGGTSKTTLDYAQSRLAFAQAEMNNKVSSMNTSISKLEFLTGKLPPFRAVTPDELEPDQHRMDFYMELAKATNTKILQNEYEKQAANYKVKVEESKYMPNLKLQVEGSHTYNDGGDTGPNRSVGAMLRFNYKVFDGFARRASKKRANSALRELEVKDTKILKELKRDLELAYNQVVSLQETIRATEAEIKSNEALQELNRENFKLGEINIIELIEGEERLNASMVKRHRLQADMYKSTFDLLILAGELTDKYFCESCDVVDLEDEAKVGKLMIWD